MTTIFFPRNLYTPALPCPETALSLQVQQYTPHPPSNPPRCMGRKNKGIVTRNRIGATRYQSTRFFFGCARALCSENAFQRNWKKHRFFYSGKTPGVSGPGVLGCSGNSGCFQHWHPTIGTGLAQYSRPLVWQFGGNWPRRPAPAAPAPRVQPGAAQDPENRTAENCVPGTPLNTGLGLS